MSQTGFTPIQLYSSSTPTNAPSAGNLTNDTKGSELAINIADKNLFFKDSTNAVNTVPIRQSSTSSDGWLSSTDWNTFNNKTSNLGTVTSVAALTLGTTGTDLSSTVANGTTTPVITLNVPTASAANRGALSAADWTTFNSKAPGVTFTTGYIPYGQGTTTLNQSSSLTFNGTKLSTNQFNTTGASTFSEALFTIGSNAANTGPNATNSLFGYRNSSVAWLISNNGTTNGYVLQMQSGSAAGTGWDFITAYSAIFGAPAVQFRVRGDGTIYAQNTTVQSVSDVRLKENIKDSTEGLATILALQPRRFDFKKGYGNDKKNQLGFIAQEIEKVFSDAVDVYGESDDPNNPYKSVGPGALIPVLVKAIQEQQVIIEQLKQKVGL